MALPKSQVPDLWISKVQATKFEINITVQVKVTVGNLFKLYSAAFPKLISGYEHEAVRLIYLLMLTSAVSCVADAIHKNVICFAVLPDFKGHPLEFTKFYNIPLQNASTRTNRSSKIWIDA